MPRRNARQACVALGRRLDRASADEHIRDRERPLGQAARSQHKQQPCVAHPFKRLVLVGQNLCGHGRDTGNVASLLAGIAESLDGVRRKANDSPPQSLRDVVLLGRALFRVQAS
eukprot:2520554-Lingulodinium_polyedra.AAC.1